MKESNEVIEYNTMAVDRILAESNLYSSLIDINYKFKNDVYVAKYIAGIFNAIVDRYENTL